MDTNSAASIPTKQWVRDSASVTVGEVDGNPLAKAKHIKFKQTNGLKVTFSGTYGDTAMVEIPTNSTMYLSALYNSGWVTASHLNVTNEAYIANLLKIGYEESGLGVLQFPAWSITEQTWYTDIKMTPAEGSGDDVAYIPAATGTTWTFAKTSNVTPKMDSSRVHVLVDPKLDSARSDVKYLSKADTASLEARKMSKSTIRVIATTGLIDSVKTTDTLYLGFSEQAMTIDSVRVHSIGACSLSVAIQMVDSLNQVAGSPTSILNATVVSNSRKVVVPTSGTWTASKVLRLIWSSIVTMPKHIVVTLAGHE
jgi:hypothetical protein